MRAWVGFGPILLAPVLVLLAFAGVGGQEAPERSTDPTTLFHEGNRLYQEGDFSGALESFQAVLDAGFESGDLFYNLGNAYFKAGDLGRSILSYERALRLQPRDPDTRANLELASSLTADEVEPLPTFWVLSALSWWTNLLPRGWLLGTVAFSYLLVALGLCTRILAPHRRLAGAGTWLLLAGGIGLLLLGSTLLGREGHLMRADWGIILAEEVSVQSAPSEDDDLTLFRVHEGTKVRVDQKTESWSEIVLEDGKVGWVPSNVFEEI